ncbi:MAG: hypothetical protein Q4G28_01840 [Neisseria sp.]|nr:hypothetical protein [Neisseria sp.]
MMAFRLLWAVLKAAFVGLGLACLLLMAVAAVGAWGWWCLLFPLLLVLLLPLQSRWAASRKGAVEAV